LKVHMRHYLSSSQILRTYFMRLPHSFASYRNMIPTKSRYITRTVFSLQIHDLKVRGVHIPPTSGTEQISSRDEVWLGDEF
jgi:hypothetical protein